MISKRFLFKIDMCHFAYITYDKTLIELRTYVRGLPMEEFEGFLIKMQTLDDTITDFTPPVSDKCVQEYGQRFRYDHVDKSSSTYVRVVVCVMKSKRTVHKKPRRRRKTQKGGLFPLAALIPALVAAGKTVALGGISGAAGYGVKKGLQAASRKRQR